MSKVNRFSRNPLGAILIALCAAVVLVPTTASADFLLRDAINGRMTADFGVVRVAEDGEGGLSIYISLNTEVLGERADLHQLYFNIVGDPGQLSGVTSDDYATPYEILVNPATKGGMASKFDFAIDFGAGSSAKGNGRLQEASFHIASDSRALVIDDLLEESMTRKPSGLSMHVAAHIQGSGIPTVVGSWVSSTPPPASSEPPEEDPDESDDGGSDGGGDDGGDGWDDGGGDDGSGGDGGGDDGGSDGGGDGGDTDGGGDGGGTDEPPTNVDDPCALFDCVLR